MLIANRCLESYLPHSVKILLTKAELLEEAGDVEKTKSYCEEIVTKRCPELLEGIVFYIELLLRQHDRDGAEELMERFSNEGRRVREGRSQITRWRRTGSSWST